MEEAICQTPKVPGMPRFPPLAFSCAVSARIVAQLAVVDVGEHSTRWTVRASSSAVSLVVDEYRAYDSHAGVLVRACESIHWIAEDAFSSHMPVRSPALQLSSCLPHSSEARVDPPCTRKRLCCSLEAWSYS